MPITYEWNKGFLTSSFTGIVTNEELIEHGRKLSDDSNIIPQIVEFVDLSSVDEMKLTKEGLQHLIGIVNANREKFNGQKVAIFAPNPTEYGFSRMYQSWYEMNDPPGEVRVFHSKEDAMEWLDSIIE